MKWYWVQNLNKKPKQKENKLLKSFQVARKSSKQRHISFIFLLQIFWAANAHNSLCGTEQMVVNSFSWCFFAVWTLTNPQNQKRKKTAQTVGTMQITANLHKFARTQKKWFVHFASTIGWNQQTQIIKSQLPFELRKFKENARLRNASSN